MDFDDDEPSAPAAKPAKFLPKPKAKARAPPPKKLTSSAKPPVPPKTAVSQLVASPTKTRGTSDSADASNAGDKFKISVEETTDLQTSSGDPLLSSMENLNTISSVYTKENANFKESTNRRFLSVEAMTENTEVFAEFDSVDDIMPQSTGVAGSTFDASSSHIGEDTPSGSLLLPFTFLQMERIELETQEEQAFTSFDFTSEVDLSSGKRASKFQPKFKQKQGKKTMENESASSHKEALVVPSETQNTNEVFIDGGSLDLPDVRIDDAFFPNPHNDSFLNHVGSFDLPTEFVPDLPSCTDASTDCHLEQMTELPQSSSGVIHDSSSQLNFSLSDDMHSQPVPSVSEEKAGSNKRKPSSRSQSPRIVDGSPIGFDDERPVLQFPPRADPQPSTPVDTPPPPPVLPDPVLHSFEAHIAHKIAKEELAGDPPREFTRRTRCYTRPTDFGRFRPYLPDDPPPGSWLWIAEQTRLTRNRDLQYGFVNHNLIGAFIEHWHPETNSFHFPWGEITITLHDVAMILGLSIEGLPATTGPFANAMQERRYCNDLFGYMFGVDPSYVSPLDKWNMTGPLRQGRVRACSFWPHVLRMIEDEDDPDCIAAGYLWYLMSSSLFVDKSTTLLQTRLLPLFDDPTRVVDTAWGAAVLANLYRELGEASRSGVVGFGGCPYLLQIWIWMYFIYFPGNPNFQRDMAGDDERHASLYHTDRTATQHELSPHVYRRILDEYRPEDICWMPYGQLDFIDRFRASTYRGTLRFLDIQEPYMPDRVVRQFGRQQSRPLDPIPPSRVCRPINKRGKNKYIVEFAEEWDRWERMQDHLCPYILESPVASPPWSVDPAYLDWYLQISHPYVSRFSQRQAPPDVVPSPFIDTHRRLALITSYVERQLQIVSPCCKEQLRNILQLATDDVPLVRATQMDPGTSSTAGPGIPSIFERGESSRMAEERAAAEAAGGADPEEDLNDAGLDDDV